jgi:hypothetical protein
MKHSSVLILVLLLGMVLGLAIGIRHGRRCERVEPAARPAPSVPVVEKPLEQMEKQEQAAGQAYRLHQLEMESGKTDLTESVAQAQKSLEQLLEDYSQVSPGAEDRSIAVKKAMVHARLARLALSEGDPLTYEQHLASALELSGEPDEESLFQKLDQLDQAQQEQLVIP